MYGTGALQPTTYDRGLCSMCARNTTACVTAAPQRLGRPQAAAPKVVKAYKAKTKQRDMSLRAESAWACMTAAPPIIADTSWRINNVFSLKHKQPLGSSVWTARRAHRLASLRRASSPKDNPAPCQGALRHPCSLFSAVTASDLHSTTPHAIPQPGCGFFRRRVAGATVSLAYKLRLAAKLNSIWLAASTTRT